MTEASASTRFSGGTSRPTADFLYETFYGGAIGGSILALFFLVVDSIAREPLFTPSLVGTAIFTDTPIPPTPEVRLDMVAYFSVFHFVAFLGVGAALSWLYRSLEPYARRSTFIVALTFAVLTGGFSVIGLTLAPGIVSVIGLVWIALGNLLTAVGMVTFLERARGESEESHAEAGG